MACKRLLRFPKHITRVVLTCTVKTLTHLNDHGVLAGQVHTAHLLISAPGRQPLLNAPADTAARQSMLKGLRRQRLCCVSMFLKLVKPQVADCYALTQLWF